MAEERTYLELSEGDTGSHKFYEVVVNGANLSIRYGRIGDAGQSQSKTFPSEDKARAEAQKKIKEKKAKGYEEAVQGVRKKRAVTRRPVVSTRSTAKKAPVLWTCPTGSSAFGIFVDEELCWVGNQAGKVLAVSHAGEVKGNFKLPDGVKCIVADGDWLYAGCDDGNVYDLSGKAPRVAYRIAEHVDIYWLDIRDGMLGVSDSDGKVHLFNHEDETQWSKATGGSSAWMVRCDEIGVYVGFSGGVKMYDWEDGQEIWSQATRGSVLFGWQEESAVFAGTSGSRVHRFSKRGEAVKEYACDAAILSCATAEDGKFVFAADNCSSVYCFAEDGTRLWKLGTDCGSALSMQYFQGKLYLVTTDGSLACVDASEEAIQQAQAGVVPTTKEIKAPTAPAVDVGAALEVTQTVGTGVVVECYEEGSRLRVRVVSEGFHSDWHVQFPKDIRVAGARYVVAEIREADRGGFYRALGEIKRLA